MFILQCLIPKRIPYFKHSSYQNIYRLVKIANAFDNYVINTGQLSNVFTACFREKLERRHNSLEELKPPLLTVFYNTYLLFLL